MYPRFAYALLFSVCAFGLGTAIPAFPVEEKCGPHAKFLECGSACAATCANPHPGPACTLQCVIGCFCEEGYLKNSQGQCVRPHECDGQTHPEAMLAAAPPPQECKENEVFLACGSACAPTCAHPQPPPFCTLQCVIGCFCKPGFLKNSHGVCVPADKCDPEPSTCGENEEYRQCKGCDGTCDRPNPPCPRICIPGCACKQGHLRTGVNGKCIPKETCPQVQPLMAAADFPSCNENEEFHACGTACPATCANPHPSPVCTKNCVIGCFCKPGFLKNSLGVCVPADKCGTEPQPCGENEEYRQCKGCDGTCAHPLVPCPAICIPGCACKEGHLRTGVNGKCIPKETCPSVAEPLMAAADFPSCKDNEEFQACGTACPATCANPHPSPVCTRNCVIGCFCKPGFLKNSHGICVPADKCEPLPQTCGENEEYRQCKGCDGTCDRPLVPCPKICIPGCACKQGHLRTGVNGKCIPQESCPKVQHPMLMAVGDVPTCNENEEFHACGTACPATCANPHPGPVCTLQCVIGCFCKPGFLKNSHGICVPADKCEPQPQTCGENEEYRQCKGCDGTCDRPLVPCPKICIPGCACKQGHLRTGVNGKCIPQESCPKVQHPMLMAVGDVPTCNDNEEFHACGTACPATCANPHPSPVCTKNCVIGCFCKPGFLKNSHGICVPADKCEPSPQTCGENEEYRQCKGCDGTCDRPNPPCPRICIPGCACKQGHLRTGVNGKCIPQETCPSHAPLAMAMAAPKTENKCPTEREFYFEECGSRVDCLSACHMPPAWILHGEPQIAKKCLERPCTAACICKHPYVRREDGRCVESEECDQVPFTTQIPL